MKLKDFITLAAFLGTLGCGQVHGPTSYPGNDSASGETVAYPGSTDDQSGSTQSGDSDEGSDSENALEPTESSDPSDPAEDTDSNETTDTSDPPTDESQPELPDSLEPPSPGTYSYERIPVSGFESAIRAAFHPSGDYALILSQYDTIHIYDWASQSVTSLSVGSNRRMQLTDIAFADDGSCAWITATQNQDGNTAMIFRFDDAAYRAQTETSAPNTLVTAFTPSMSGKSAKAIAIPWDGSFPIVVFESGQSGNYIWTLRNFHPITGEFETLYTSTNAGSPAEDIAIVNNEFGTWGALIVGGASNADALYYTELGADGEWRSGLGNMGNANRVEAYPGGQYALVVSWSGRSLYRFKEGNLSSYSDALRFSSMGIWDVSFKDDGSRALISGRASSQGDAGTMLEYRHDLYTCENTASPCAENAMSDVSIGGFSSAPWQGTGNTYIFDTAFRPGCDGGILVGGYNTSSGSGFLGEFQIENQLNCRSD